MWPSSSGRQINYGLTTDMNMVGVGLRDLFVVAPPQHHHQDSSTISFDPLHSSNYAAAGMMPLLSATRGSDSCTAMPDLLKCGNIDAPGPAGSTVVCLDCGNQAKKDCGHGRCRTCCKSRGYDCTTHLKSTWIPAATRRRDKQPSTSSGSKRPRLLNTGTGSDHTSTSNTTTPRSFDNSCSQRDASFKEGLPEQVQAPAKFKCMRFISVEDGEDEYAYEALVKIGGHIFKGVLYDNGVAHPKDGIPKIAELHLGGFSGGVTIAR